MNMSERTMPVDCVQFDEILADINRKGTREAELRDAALAHAETCGRCGLRLIESEWLDFALKSLVTRDAERPAASRAEAALLQRFRREKGIAARRKLQWQIAALAAVAAVLLALGISYGRRDVRALPSAPAINVAVNGIAANRVAAIPSSAVASNRVQGAQSEAKPARAYGQRRKVASADYNSDSDRSESAANFIALPYSDDPRTLDGSAVVRVTLTQSALASFGLPVSEFGSSDRVSADLVVSEDGTAEAIRLVPSRSTRDF